MPRQEPYQPALAVDKISIPAELVDFFQQDRKWNLWTPSVNKRGIPLSYAAVVGADAPSPFTLTKTSDQEEVSFTNERLEDILFCEKVIKRALTTVYGQARYGDIRRSYMVNTETHPVRIKFSVEGKKKRKSLYVKKPDISRLIGSYLYEVITGTEPIRYAFNESICIESEVSGTLASRFDERIKLSRGRYIHNLARASVHAQFLGISDVGNPRNRVISRHDKTVLFDFHRIFDVNHGYEHNTLLEYAAQQGAQFDDITEEFRVDEMHKVARRVEENWHKISRLAKIIGPLRDESLKSLNFRVKQNYGCDDVEDYFARRVEDYKRSEPTPYSLFSGL